MLTIGDVSLQCLFLHMSCILLLKKSEKKPVDIHLAKDLKGKYHGFLVSFGKNDEIRPSISCQIILE